MSSVARPGFYYQPLVELDSIRLIILHPANDVTAQLECSIEHTTLSDCDEDLINHYSALSYVWGDPEDLKQIIVAGCTLKITANLDSALHHLRDRKEFIRVWADAICINQNDVKERNQQVQQMASVYLVAHHTVIYLGDASEIDEHVFSKSNILCVGSYSAKLSVNLRKEYSNVELEAIHEILETRILSRPWFTRVWIFQELVLSRDPWVQCVSKRCRWNDFCQLAFAIRDRVHGRRQDLANSNPDNNPANEGRRVVATNTYQRAEAIRRLEYMQSARQKFQVQMQGSGPGNDLLTVLALRRGMGVLNPRDMIYAHLGFASNSASENDRLKVDYKKSVIQVYVDAALYFLDQRHQYYQYDILAQVEDVHPVRRHAGLPSWVPDWTLNEIQYQLTSNHQEPTDHWNVPPVFSYGLSSEGKSQLFCKGRIYGRIGDIGENVLSFAHLSQDEVSRAWSPYIAETTASKHEKLYETLGEECVKAVGLRQVTDFIKVWKLELAFERPRLTDVHPVASVLSKAFTASYSSADVRGLEGKRFCQVGPDELGPINSWSEVALVPQWTQTGDLICSLHGDSRMFVFRRASGYDSPGMESDGGVFNFVGVCYTVRLYWAPRDREAGIEQMFILQ